MNNPNVPRPSPRTPRGRQLGNRSTVTPGAQLAPDLAKSTALAMLSGLRPHEAALLAPNLATIIAQVMTALAVCDANERAQTPQKAFVGETVTLVKGAESEVAARLVYVGKATCQKKEAGLRRFDRKFITVDSEGGYYFVNWQRFLSAETGRWQEHSARSALMKISGKGALALIAGECIEDDHLAVELTRAIDNRLFAFMSEVPAVAVAKRRTKAQRKAARVFAEQLEMAWDKMRRSLEGQRRQISGSILRDQRRSINLPTTA